MGRGQAEVGTCRICGTHGKLSFEHVPPRAAFNGQRTIAYRGHEAIEIGPDRPTGRGAIQQRGAGGFTLCAKCNNFTGAQYGSRFVEWCRQGMEILRRSAGRPTLVYLYRVSPLRVLKQVVTMFCSVNTRLADRFPEVRRFVLNCHARPLPPRMRLYAYFNCEGGSRRAGMSSIVNLASGSTIVLSEISFPPYGYVMTVDSLKPDPRLADISHFDQYLLDEYATKELRMTALPTHLALPGDYRTREQIADQRDEAMRWESANALAAGKKAG